MIQTKTPFRISFMGGRSDMPSFYREEMGLVVATSIDKYIQIDLSDKDHHHFWLRYEQEEVVKSIADIEHDRIREAFLLFEKIKALKGISLKVSSDIPSGTGLGSSSTFTVGLLNALQNYSEKAWSKSQLAEQASQLEIQTLSSNIGKQDQYCAAYGGLNKYLFHTDGHVEVEPIKMKDRASFEESVCVFFTGIQRDGAKVLEKEKAQPKLDEIAKMRDLAIAFSNELESSADLKTLGEIMDEGWKIKSALSSAISNPQINDYYERAKKAGAAGGKLLGAGGGGYLLFLCAPELQKDLQSALSGLKRLPIKFEDQGSRIL